MNAVVVSVAAALPIQSVVVMGVVFGVFSRCILSDRFDELAGKLTLIRRMKHRIFIDNEDRLGVIAMSNL